EFQSLVGPTLTAAALQGGSVGQRFAQQFRTGEFVTENRFERLTQRNAPCADPSVNAGEHAGPADLERPLPEFPPGVFGVDGKEQEFGAANKVLDRNEADTVHEAAVRGVVPVIAHGEQMIAWDGVDWRVVDIAFVGGLQDVVANAVRHGLDVAAQYHVDAALVGDEVSFRLTLAELAVDIEQSLAHLDRVTGQTDDSFDVIGGVVAWVLEHRDVAAVRQTLDDTAGERWPAERQRI